jgi:lysophospholipase L1-like esterase
MTRLGVALILLAIAAAAFGRLDLFNLVAEEPARSIRRFATGAAEVEVTAQMPWSRVPAVLPGPADAWAGGTPHAIAVRLEVGAPRALALWIRTTHARPPGLPATVPPTGDSRARVGVLVNGTRVATLNPSGLGGPPARRKPRASPRIRVAIPATALATGAPVKIALLNDRGPGVGLQRLRLSEARPAFSPSLLRLGGPYPAVSAALLAAGLGCLLRGRLRRARDGLGAPAWRRGLGPALGVLILGLAVAAPAGTAAVPRWAYLLLILSVLPLGARPATVRRAPAARLGRAAGNLVLLLGALVVSLVAGELALRAVFRDEPWARNLLRIPGPPNREHSNSLGFDEREFPLEKPPGIYRIAVLGDSLSVSAPRAERFGRVLADRLNAHPPSGVTFEALNFGRTGLDTDEETEVLRTSVWRAHPDFVLLEWYVNDLENGNHAERPRPAPLLSGESAPARWLRRATDRTLLSRMLEEEYGVLREGLGLTETYPAYMHRLFAEPDAPRWPEGSDALRAFVAECRAHHTPVAIALFPHLSAGLPAGAYEFAELHDQVLELCRQESVPCVDLRSTFAPYPDYSSFWLHRFNAHPNARAHRLAGERLAEVLGPLWLDLARTRGASPPRGPGPAGALVHARTGGSGTTGGMSLPR